MKTNKVELTEQQGWEIESTTEMEMKPRWWQTAREAATVAKAEIEAMHPFEKEEQDTTIEECEEVIAKIDESRVQRSTAKWETLEMTPDNIRVLWEGLVDMHFQAREEAGGEWSDVEHDREWKWLYRTLSNLGTNQIRAGPRER